VYVCVSCVYVRLHVFICVYVGGQVGLYDAELRSHNASATPFHCDCAHGRCHTGTSFLRLSFVPALCGVERRAKKKISFAL